MITPELLSFIEKEKTKGATNEQIKAMLVQNGWLASDAEEGFAKLISIKPVIPPPPVTPVTPLANPAPSYQPAYPPTIPTTEPIHSTVLSEPEKIAPVSAISQIPVSSIADSMIQRPASVAQEIPQKSYKGIILAVAGILIIMGGAFAYFSPTTFRTWPILKNIDYFRYTPSVLDTFPVPPQSLTPEEEAITILPDNQIVPTDNTTTRTSSDNQATIACKEEKSKKIKQYNSSTIQGEVVVGQIIFLNKKYTYESLVVKSGAIDESKIKNDGSFCIIRNKVLNAGLVFVDSGDTNIFLAINNPALFKNGVLVIDARVTAQSILALGFLPAYFLEDNTLSVVELTKTLPQAQDFVDAFSTEILNAPPGVDSFQILDKPEIKKLQQSAIEAMRKSLEDQGLAM